MRFYIGLCKNLMSGSFLARIDSSWSQTYTRTWCLRGICSNRWKAQAQKIVTASPVVHTGMLTTSLLLPPDFTHNISSLYSSNVSAEITDAQVKRAVDDISDKFSEAMELMNDARSSIGTVYFSEDVLDTQAQVEETLQDYNTLLSRLNDKQRRNVIQSIGLKMEELKAQMALLEDLAKE